MQNRSKQKTDGHIKNQTMRLKEMRLNILLKISCVIVPMTILLAILWGIFSINPPPEKWEKTQITYSSISRNFCAQRNLPSLRKEHAYAIFIRQSAWGF